MDLDKLGLKELLFLYFNTKGEKKKEHKNKNGKQSYERCALGEDVPEYFCLETQVSNAKKTNSRNPDLTEHIRDLFCDKLNHYYQLSDDDHEKFKRTSGAKTALYFDNKWKVSITDFSKKLYTRIMRRFTSYKVETYSKYVAIAAFGFRGSFDLNGNFYTADLYDQRMTETEVAQLVYLLGISNLDDQLNLNFRNLQKQGTSRNTQFRINLKYFSDHFLPELKKVNPYRYEQFQWNAPILDTYNTKKPNSGFLYRINFYLENIVSRDHDMNDVDIKSLREKLNLTNDLQPDSKGEKRSNRAHDLALLKRPDECAGCHNKYDRSDRTFRLRNKSGWYFEMHHVISYANNKKYGIETELPSNYVKLCPACHRALTPGRARKEDQMTIIDNILKDDPDTKKYVQEVQSNIHDKELPDKFVYQYLQ